MKRLIVNADDFGRSPGVNRGIVEAHERGIVTSTTLMVNMPFADEALTLAKGHPELGVGIHLVFTAGCPILPPERVSTLVDQRGRFLDQRTLASRLGSLDLTQLRAELAAQIERFLRRGGCPTHLDCHHFLHVHPDLFAVLVELADEYSLPMRLPFGRGFEATAQREARRFGMTPDALLEMGWRDIELVEARSIPHPDRFIGEFFGDGASVENLLRILAGLEEGVTELMTHPGYADEELLRTSSYARERERELAALTDPRVQESIEGLGIELVNFSVLKRR